MAKFILPILDRLTQPDLLKRYAAIQTQNAKERFNSVLWSHCHKIEFTCCKSVEIVVALSTLRFDCGPYGIFPVWRSMDIVVLMEYFLYGGPWILWSLWNISCMEVHGYCGPCGIFPVWRSMDIVVLVEYFLCGGPWILWSLWNISCMEVHGYCGPCGIFPVWRSMDIVVLVEYFLYGGPWILWSLWNISCMEVHGYCGPYVGAKAVPIR